MRWTSTTCCLRTKCSIRQVRLCLHLLLNLSHHGQKASTQLCQLPCYSYQTLEKSSAWGSTHAGRHGYPTWKIVRKSISWMMENHCDTSGDGTIHGETGSLLATVAELLKTTIKNGYHHIRLSFLIKPQKGRKAIDSAFAVMWNRFR